jgi:hypothetical protein
MYIGEIYGFYLFFFRYLFLWDNALGQHCENGSAVKVYTSNDAFSVWEELLESNLYHSIGPKFSASILPYEDELLVKSAHWNNFGMIRYRRNKVIHRASNIGVVFYLKHRLRLERM